MLGINLKDLVLHALNLVLLFVILRAFLYQPVVKFMNARTQRFADQADELVAWQDQLQQKEASFSAIEAEAREKAQQTIREGSADAQKAADNMLQQAQLQADAMVEKARQEIAREKEQAQAVLREEAAHAAVGIASQILEREVSEKDNAKLIDAYFERVK